MFREILITFLKTHVLTNGFLILALITWGHPYFQKTGGVTDMKKWFPPPLKSTFEKKLVFKKKLFFLLKIFIFFIKSEF